MPTADPKSVTFASFNAMVLPQAVLRSASHGRATELVVVSHSRKKAIAVNRKLKHIRHSQQEQLVADQCAVEKNPSTSGQSWWS